MRALIAVLKQMAGHRENRRAGGLTNREGIPEAGDVLEVRQMMSVDSIWFSGTTLVVKANDNATNVEVVKSGSSIRIRDIGANRNYDYSASSVGKVEFQGGAGNDRFVNSVEKLAVKVFGNGGDDYLEGYAGVDYFSGGAGNDTIKGYGGNDQIVGGSGNDWIDGGAGDDRLEGGSGNDEILGSMGDDIVWGDSGNDKVWGGSGNDELQGGTGNDELMGEAGNDRLFGDEDLDKLWGGDQNDMLNGGDGKDEMYGGAGTDSAWLSEAGETVTSTSEAVHIWMPSGTPQLPNKCGPNSAWRVIRSYGGRATHQEIIDNASANSTIARMNLGTTGSSLVSAMNQNRRGLGSYSFSLKTRSSVGEIVKYVAQGRPVVAMISVGSERISALGLNAPKLHWVAVHGFDTAKQLIYYTNTDGKSWQMSMSDFGSALNWSADLVTRNFLQGLGVVPGTFIV